MFKKFGKNYLEKYFESSDELSVFLFMLSWKHASEDGKEWTPEYYYKTGGT